MGYFVPEAQAEASSAWPDRPLESCSLAGLFAATWAGVILVADGVAIPVVIEVGKHVPALFPPFSDTVRPPPQVVLERARIQEIVVRPARRFRKIRELAMLGVASFVQ